MGYILHVVSAAAVMGLDYSQTLIYIPKLKKTKYFFQNSA
jgi:hypothetical protein